MPVPTLVTDLSTTLASNSPAGSDNVFPSLDDYLRSLSGFIASIRDNSGNGWVSPYLPLTYSAGTANGVVYLNGSKVVTTGSGLVFDGTNLGIGTSSPGVKLDVNGSGRFVGAMTASYASGFDNTYISQNGATGNGCIMATLNFAQTVYQPITYDASYYVWRPSGTERMRLDSSGNLGIGTSSPTAKLHVTGGGFSDVRNAVLVDGVSDASFQISAWQGVSGSTDGTVIGRVGLSYTTTKNALINFHRGSSVTGGFLSFSTNDGTESARFTSGGALVVGHIAAAGSEVLCASLNSASTAPFCSWNRATAGDNFFAGWFTEGTATIRGSIDYNRAGGLVRYNTTSDYRAKDIIGPVQNPGATIDALKVYEGVMKGATQSRPMLIAHEAQAVAPYAVSGVKDEVNEDGTPKFQQMDVSSLVPLLLAEIQSLRARVAALEAA